jgi:hypothetical protein
MAKAGMRLPKLVALAGLCLCGCATAPGGKASVPTSTVRAMKIKLAEGKQTLLLATAAADNGLFFTRPPYDLIGMFGASKGASIGFTNFRVPTNGVPASPPPAAQEAMNSCYEAALLVLEAAYAVDGPTVIDGDAIAADGFLVQATSALAGARSQIEALSVPADQADAALAAVDVAALELGKARRALGRRRAHGAEMLLRSISTKLFVAALQVTDALIPDDLRAALPGGGI